MYYKCMKYELPKLPYGFNALEPYIDAQTMELHYSKHHQTYANKLGETIDKHPELAEKTPEWMLKNLDQIPEDIRTAVRNHGGGYLNHNFFWTIMAPKDSSIGSALPEPSDEFKSHLVQAFGSYEEFRSKFAGAAMGQFGSGWAWLVYSTTKSGLEIYSLPNQDSPLTKGDIPLLCIDIWEHAYYLKYQNRRQEYVENFWNLVNWKKVEENFKTVSK